MKIVVTAVKNVQIGIDEFVDHRVSHIFDSSNTLDSMLEWVSKTINSTKPVPLCECILSELVE